ncbi:glycosyltransferase family 4 protein [Altererythrobacter sp. SALINAS58]|uniref:glycosyltransferase family 4 protein n=1 Tax=Alteripontixanthobacter muriae TaxID=2705546 RepID=UPI001576C4F2|nr:glycosyltransferase family 4 protein [Alteripontixanthobacter muriae]NTZ43947.1 glycosyltransferase family 4 protein [Alteripontixanthobacter muriae]
MKLLFALPGFHRYDRGAEVALLSVATELARSGDEVVVAGSGEPRPNTPYQFHRVPSVRRERFELLPKFPPLRTETAWEDATFAANLMIRERLTGYDATITCSFPFTQWALRAKSPRRAAHVFVTQNGDWPAFTNSSEYRSFGCDGLVCTNPDYLTRNEANWRCALIPNGVDTDRFQPGAPCGARFGFPDDMPVVLMVSALIESKRVLEGIRAAAKLDNVFLAVAGDGPLRDEARELAASLLPGRYKQLTLSAHEMPELYRSADAFLHLSLLESFGNVFLEAWACGLPVVAHESDRLRWILGSGQFLCDTEDEKQLVEHLRSAIAAGKSAPSAGIEQFTWPSIAAQYRAFIGGIVGR